MREKSYASAFLQVKSHPQFSRWASTPYSTTNFWIDNPSMPAPAPTPNSCMCCHWPDLFLPANMLSFVSYREFCATDLIILSLCHHCCYLGYDFSVVLCDLALLISLRHHQSSLVVGLVNSTLFHCNIFLDIFFSYTFCDTILCCIIVLLIIHEIFFRSLHCFGGYHCLLFGVLLNWLLLALFLFALLFTWCLWYFLCCCLCHNVCI